MALPDGRPLTVALIPDYIATLTPMVLTRDTRVTNHGYRDGRATKLQSTLQKGTAVLTDQKGVPRVKCYCGNPLLPPVATSGRPVYRGSVWEGFQPAQVTVVQQTTNVINVFVLTDITTGGLFDRPVGTTGANDTPNAGTATTTTAAPTTAAPTTAAPTTAAPTTAAPTTAPPTTAAPTTAAPNPSCSPDSNQAASLDVTNDRTGPIDIFFVDGSCNLVPQGSLAAGQSFQISSFVGHQFVAKGTDGSTISDFTVSPGSNSWTVR